MNRFSPSAAWAMALILGMGWVAGCGGSSGSGGSSSAPPSITNFTASPTTITAGASVNLTGVFTNGFGVIAPGSLPATSGTAVSVSPTTTTTYTLTVTNSVGAAVTKTVKVTVNPGPAITSFTANPASILAGQSSSLTGVFTNGTGVITPGNLSVTSGTAVSVTPVATTTYTLTVTPANGPAVTQTASVGIEVPSTVTVDQSSVGPAVTDQLLGMNLAAWYDVTSSANEPAIQTAFATAGIKAVRWPGGSWSDAYNWETNTECANFANSDDDFTDFVNKLVIPSGVDLALTADYGTGKNCTGPGDPTEAAAWVTEASALGVTVSHMTVGNEEYGSWEADNHTHKNDGATYATATAGASGYYALVKAASPKTLVGVSVEPNYAPWDQDVLSGAKGSYDFVEYHYYPQGPGTESDSYLVNQAPQDLTANLTTIRSEMTKWGTPNTPIYVGEMGSVYTLPGRQSSSITQALFAGQVLGEMMNDGVSRATWWIGFGGCDDTNSYQTLSNGTLQYANFDTPGLAYQTSVYGWQDFGGYMVFADGPSESGCEGSTLETGTLLPTARAYQLFSSVAVNGENVLTASVAGNTADVVAYAATHSGGTALVLFNRNEVVSEPVTITLSGQAAATAVTVETYDKAIYDLSNPATTNTWAPPTSSNLGAQSLPLTLTLTPWSMNVVLIK